MLNSDDENEAASEACKVSEEPKTSASKQLQEDYQRLVQMSSNHSGSSSKAAPPQRQLMITPY